LKPSPLVLARTLVLALIALVVAPATSGATPPNHPLEHPSPLALNVATTARAGSTASVVLQDPTQGGGLPLTICVTPPGGTPACRPADMSAGQSHHVVRIAVPRPGGWRITVKTKSGSQTSATLWVKPPAGRLRVLAVGDSEMLALESYLASDLSPHGADVTSAAKSGTGLTLTYAFNWVTTARQQATTLRPDVTVMFIGANDVYVTHGTAGKTIDCCSSAWSAGYSLLVGAMMQSYLRGDSGRVYWFVLPTPRPKQFRYVFDGVDAGIREAAARYPGRVALIDANAYFTPHNRYRDHMTVGGNGFTIHQSDGIHLTTTSDLLAAALVVKQMLADSLIR
jgi:hypothetical protein